MKKICIPVVITSLMLCIPGCTSQRSEKLTQEQKDQIKQEIKVVFDSIFDRYENLDVNGALKYYSQEMVHGGDTVLQDFQGYKNAGIDIFKTVDSVKWTSGHLECIVLSKDLVLTYWVGKGRWLFKSKNRLINDPNIYTNIIKNENGRWKVIFEQYTGQPKWI
jgi:hypothetical protein